jgi:hypothetical protein
MTGYHQGAGLDTQDHHRAYHQRRCRISRNPQRQQGDEGRLRPGIIGRLGTRDPRRMSLAESFGMFGDLLFDRVRGERREGRTPAWKNAEQAADDGAPDGSRPRFLELLPAGVQRPHLACEADAFLAQFQVADDLGETKHAHGHRSKINAVLQLQDTEVVTRYP